MLARLAVCQVIQSYSSAVDLWLQYEVTSKSLASSGVATSEACCVCAGILDKCTQGSSQYLTALTPLLQHCDLPTTTFLRLAAHHSSTFPELLSNSPGGCVYLPVQRSLPESRLFSITALAPNNQAGPDISLLSPLLQSQFDDPSNAHLGHVVIKPQSNTKVWWTCSQCPDGHSHNWLATPSNRFGWKGRKGTGCPFCANRKVCQHNSLPTKAPYLVPEWSEENKFSPHEFTVSSHKKAWWRCECGCEWEASITHRAGLGTGCPDCAIVRRSGKQKRHPTLRESQHEMLQLWDWGQNEEAGLDPSKLRCRSNKKAHWVCHKCPVGQPHKWQATVGNMYASMLRGTPGCPCCKGMQACKCNSLQSLFPEVAAEWDYERNTGTPADYAAQSHKEVWWHNSRRGHFKVSAQHRTQAWASKQQISQVS